MKEIFIETMDETKDLTEIELRSLIQKKNSRLGLCEDKSLEEMNKTQLITLIGEKNILLITLNK